MKRILLLIIATTLMAHAQTPSQLQAQITALQKTVAALQANKALQLGPFVDVVSTPQLGVRGPNITFHGANIHIVSGFGRTDDSSGFGNLIIGYNEDPGTQGVPLISTDRYGSHNLIIGRWHKFVLGSFGGFVAGELNRIEGEANSILSGSRNRALGIQTSITGGMSNQVAGPDGVIVGGGHNIVDAAGQGVVLGGNSNYLTGQNSVILGLSNVSEPGDYKVTQ